jgi:hypothetical protein
MTLMRKNESNRGRVRLGMTEPCSKLCVVFSGALSRPHAMWIDAATSFHKSLAALPLTIYRAGETVLADGSRTDRLLILRKGNVAIVKEGIEIARVTEPGAVFGEISALLDCRCLFWTRHWVTRLASGIAFWQSRIASGVHASTSSRMYAIAGSGAMIITIKAIALNLPIAFRSNFGSKGQ